MDDIFSRTELLLGSEAMERLSRAHVLVVGVGGVGSWACEMLARSGVGRLTLVDADRVSRSNINRQLPALCSTVGREKVEVLRERLSDINPRLQVEARCEWLEAEGAEALPGEVRPDFVCDCIDTLGPKVALLSAALRAGLRVVSAMGAGAKTDIREVRQADLWRTTNCPLARSVRQGLRREGLEGKPLPVVFSAEPPQRHAVVPACDDPGKKTTCGTVSYLPAAFGLHMAAYVIRCMMHDA